MSFSFTSIRSWLLLFCTSATLTQKPLRRAPSRQRRTAPPPRNHRGKEQRYHRREPHHDDEEQYHHRGDNILEDAAILPPELRQYLPTMLTLRQYFDMLLRQYLPTFTSLIKYGVLWICIELLHRL